MANLCREVGANALREIGAELGIKSAAVSLAVKRIRQQSPVDRGLRMKLEAVKHELVKSSKT